MFTNIFYKVIMFFFEYVYIYIYIYNIINISLGKITPTKEQLEKMQDLMNSMNYPHLSIIVDDKSPDQIFEV
jgi:hypothetical protein